MNVFNQIYDNLIQGDIIPAIKRLKQKYEDLVDQVESTNMFNYAKITTLKLNAICPMFTLDLLYLRKGQYSNDDDVIFKRKLWLKKLFSLVRNLDSQFVDRLPKEEVDKHIEKDMMYISLMI